MKIIIKTKNLKLNQALRNFIEEKINSLERFFKEEKFLAKARVEIEKTTLHHKKGPFFRTECQIQLPGRELRAESVSENLYLSINEVKDELQRELKQYKNKMIAKRKRGARVLKKEIHLSPLARLNFEKNFGGQARFYRKGRIREEGI